MNPETLVYLWLVAGVALIAAETVIPEAFLPWIGLGALSAGVGGVFGLSGTGQVVVFVVASMGWIALYQLKIKPRLRKATEVINRVDTLVGVRGKVVERREGYLRVNVRDTIWTALAENDVSVGDDVVVTTVDAKSLVLTVKK